MKRAAVYRRTGRKQAVIYKRVSTTRQKEEGTSLLTQEQGCRRYCDQHDYDVVAVFEDDHSGADMDRPGLDAMRDYLREHRADVVVCYALDRLSRDQTHQAVLLYEIEEDRGCTVEFVTETLDDSPTGRFMRQALGFVAEIERAKIEERTQRGQRARVASGKLWVGSVPLYGYRYTDETKSAYEPDPQNAPVVERIFRDAAGGVTLLGLARSLTSEGVPPPSRRQPADTRRQVATIWRRAILHKIIRNPAYKGEHEAFKYGRDKKRVLDPATGKMKTVHTVVRREKGIPMPASVCPALVDEHLWQAANDRLAANKALAARNNRHPEAALLRGGFARCGYCGATLTVAYSKGHAVYRCRNRAGYEDSAGGPCPGKGMSILCSVLDRAVWEDFIVPAVFNEKNVKSLLAHVERLSAGTNPLVEEQQRVKGMLERAQERHAQVVARIARVDDLTAEALYQTAADLADHIKGYQKRLAELEADAGATARHQRDLTALAAWAKVASKIVDKLTYQQKRLVLTMTDCKVVLFRTEDRDPRWDVKHNFTPQGVLNSVYNGHALWTQMAFLWR